MCLIFNGWKFDVSTYGGKTCGCGKNTMPSYLFFNISCVTIIMSQMKIIKKCPHAVLLSQSYRKKFQTVTTTTKLEAKNGKMDTTTTRKFILVVLFIVGLQLRR